MFLQIIENTKDRKFKISSDMMNLLGCTKENFYKLMTLMNYKKENESQDTFSYKGAKKINKIKFINKKSNPFQKLTSLNLK